MGKKLYVGNLSYEVTDSDLAAMFAPHGTAASAQSKRPMTFLDVQNMRQVGAPDLSADGRWLLYTVSVPDWREARRQSDIYLVSTDRGLSSTRQLTFTKDKTESTPRWAHDGSFFVFASDRDATTRENAPGGPVAPRAVAAPNLPAGGAFAQGKMAPAPAAAPPPGPPMQLKQIALTEKQIDGAVAASKEMDPITAKLQPNAKPDPKVIAQLEGVAKKNGFASYEDYNAVMDNIGAVFSGIDPASKKYVGPEAVLKAQIAEVQADKKMSPKDKKAAVDDLNMALKEPAPEIQNKGNIDLVVKNYDKLSPIMGENQQ